MVNPSLWKEFGVTGPGSSNPEADLSVLANLSTLLKQIQSSLGADDISGLATLAQNVETIEEKGAVSEGDLQTIESQLSALAENPMLTGPDLTAVNAFISELKSLPPGTIPLSGSSNQFLNCSAILVLFQVCAKIIVELAEIQYAEAKMRIKEMEMQMEAAKSASILTEEAGEIAAQKDMIQANTEYAQAGLALASGIGSAITALIGSFRASTAYRAYEKAHENDMDKAELATQAFKAANMEEQQWNRLGQSVNSVTEAAKDLASAIKDQQLSSKEIQEATLKAASAFLNTLSELQSQAASTMGQSVNNLEQEIKTFLDKYVESMRAWGQAWGRG